MSGEFYFKYPSQATTTQIDPTLTGIRYAKGLTEKVLQNTDFVLPTSSSISAYNLLIDNKEFIQNETITFLNSAWSFFEYNKAKCRRDVGYMIDAVATDVLYGGNERAVAAASSYWTGQYGSAAAVPMAAAVPVATGCAWAFTEPPYPNKAATREFIACLPGVPESGIHPGLLSTIWSPGYKIIVVFPNLSLLRPD